MFSIPLFSVVHKFLNLLLIDFDRGKEMKKNPKKTTYIFFCISKQFGHCFQMLLK